MELPKIEIKKTGKTYKVVSHEHTYGENMTEGEANRLYQMLNHYRSVATMELLCQGLDGESSKIKAEYLPLTAEQIGKLYTPTRDTLDKDNLLVHQGSGAVFFITSLNVDPGVQSNLVAAGMNVELVARNYQG